MVWRAVWFLCGIYPELLIGLVGRDCDGHSCLLYIENNLLLQFSRWTSRPLHFLPWVFKKSWARFFARMLKEIYAHTYGNFRQHLCGFCCVSVARKPQYINGEVFRIPSRNREWTGWDLLGGVWAFDNMVSEGFLKRVTIWNFVSSIFGSHCFTKVNHKKIPWTHLCSRDFV
jgi:hypothetical protein